jgi:hypothetical protein
MAGWPNDRPDDFITIHSPKRGGSSTGKSVGAFGFLRCLEKTPDSSTALDNRRSGYGRDSFSGECPLPRDATVFSFI